MKGIYIHIPFCRQACRYCDFFFSVSLHYMDEYVVRLVDEINIHGSAYSGESLDTLYLGGGTPSLLSMENLDMILDRVLQVFSFQKDAEVTIECNPDDLKPSFLQCLKTRGFNRISIGVQSFHEKDLKLMRRSHNAMQAEQSVRNAVSAGFENISIDLIYGIPGQTSQEWEESVQRAIALPVSHLSAYHLTFEPGTIFDHWRKKGTLFPVPEQESILFYKLLRDRLLSEGYDHYEISNFTRDGKMSRHNLLYWSGLPYLGVGPSAHSFDGSNRSWNISSLKKYMEGIARGESICEKEILSQKERYHDYLITSLRTKWGADPNHIQTHFGNAFLQHFELKAQPFLEKGTIYMSKGKESVPERGKTGDRTRNNSGDKTGNNSGDKKGDRTGDRTRDKTREEIEGNMAIQPNQWLITDLILRELFMD